MSGHSEAAKKVERAERVISHALVELRRHKWWPFGVRSAVLLDVSEGGFKIEFTAQTNCVAGQEMLLEIPLGPFGITSPSSVVIDVQLIWFDPQRMRCGGIFKNKNAGIALFLEKIISASKSNNSL